MIVTWSESYLRTSLTTAIATIRTSPPNISAHLVEPPPPPVPRPVAPAPPPTQLHNIVNRTDQEREAASATTVSNSNWQNNLPDVRYSSKTFTSLFHILYSI